MAWSIERCYQDQHEIFLAMLDSLESARVSIDFESFIFERDSLGKRLIQSFIRASQRGVKVRLLVDGVGSPEFDETIIRDLENHGVRTRIYRPWRAFVRALIRTATRFQWKTFIREFAEMNRRNHRKTCIIDRRKAWIGSANVSLRHEKWRETTAYVEGEDTSLIAQSFDWLWARSRHGWKYFADQVSPPTNDFVHTSYGFSAKRKTVRFQRVLIDSARSRIRIISPYFVPPLPLLMSLLRARKNGVRVEVMIPHETDYKIMHRVARSYYSVLWSAGVVIYEYLPSMLHSKVLIVDDVALVGSSNFNFRSFLHDLEVDVLLRKKESIGALDLQWENDVRSCSRVEFPRTRPFGKLGVFVEEIYFRILSFFKRIL